MKQRAHSKKNQPLPFDPENYRTKGFDLELSELYLAKPLMKLKVEGYENKYLELIDEAMTIWDRGKAFQRYSHYLLNIVFAYFRQLKRYGSYDSLKELEKKIAQFKDHDALSLLTYHMAELRQSYASYFTKPANVSEAIRRYNEAREYDDKKITTSKDLFQQLQDAFDTEVRQWVEGQGAYSLIIGKRVLAKQRQEYERFVQITLNTKIESILAKRGFNIQIIREPEQIDGTKVDFLVRYGFIGPVLIEIKLSSNTDLRGNQLTQSDSYKKMKRYMQGYGAKYGFFLVMEKRVLSKEKRTSIEQSYRTIPGVQTLFFRCIARNQAKNATKKQAARRSNSAS